MKRYIFLVLFLYCAGTPTFSQDFTDSNLPIIMINTDGVALILDSPRVLATMKIINRGAGLRNFVSDRDSTKFLDYNGRIDIEIRGSSSQTVPKKQYGFSTLKADNISNNNISLLGLPKENDWILNGLAFEPSLIRDYLNYNLSRMIGQYASKTVYCEVMINDSYNGLYVLEEKIKQGDNRVNVTKIETGDNSFPKITGGYITKADKNTGGDPVAWSWPTSTNVNVDFIHVLPKPENVTPAQSIYIQSEFEKLRNSVAIGDASFESGYPSVIDIPSFVDYMIINEISANADAYQYSTFYHKDRNGKLRAGPIWDLNLTYGYDLALWGFDRSKTFTWQFANGDNEGPPYWKGLFNDPRFRCCLSRRWNKLIEPGQPLNYASIEAFIDTTVALISEAAVRENSRWYTVPDFTGEVTKIKNFLKERIPWMTSNIGPASNCDAVEVPPLVITKIMYNPATSVGFPNADEQEFLEIKNTGNKTVNLAGTYFSGTGFIYQFPPTATILQNSTKILANKMDVFTAIYGFSPSGQFTRNLSNSGEYLVLADGFGNIIDSVHYTNRPPWPDADGNGSYLELADPALDNSIGSNWIASTNTLVSVDDAVSNQDMKFYPTPVRDFLNIESSANIKILQLYDFQGRQLKTIIVNSETFSLDMSSCKPGIYMVEIVTKNGNIVKKVLKE